MNNFDTGLSSSGKIVELCLQIARQFRHDFAFRISHLGLTFAQARALEVVAGSKAPLRMVDLASKLQIVPRSVTSIVDALEKGELVRRVNDVTDRRTISVEISQSGESMVRHLDELKAKTADEMFAFLGAVDRVRLIELLTKTPETSTGINSKALEGATDDRGSR